MIREYVRNKNFISTNEIIIAMKEIFKDVFRMLWSTSFQMNRVLEK